MVANAVNMGLRIWWCWGFVGGWLGERTTAGKDDRNSREGEKDSKGGEDDGKRERVGKGERKDDGEKKVRFGVLEVLPKPGAVAAAVVARSVVSRVVGGGEEVMGAKEAIWELVKIAGVAVPFVVAV